MCAERIHDKRLQEGNTTPPRRRSRHRHGRCKAFARIFATPQEGGTSTASQRRHPPDGPWRPQQPKHPTPTSPPPRRPHNQTIHTTAATMQPARALPAPLDPPWTKLQPRPGPNRRPSPLQHKPTQHPQLPAAGDPAAARRPRGRAPNHSFCNRNKRGPPALAGPDRARPSRSTHHRCKPPPPPAALRPPPNTRRRRLLLAAGLRTPSGRPPSWPPRGEPRGLSPRRPLHRRRLASPGGGLGGRRGEEGCRRGGGGAATGV